MVARAWWILVVFVCAAAACGGGSDGAEPVATTEPDRADAPEVSAGSTAEERNTDAAEAPAHEIVEIQIEARGFVFDALAAGAPDGELVVLLHGFPQTAAMWRPQIEALAAAGYRVVAPNQRGYSPGAQPTGTEAYTLDEVAADTMAMVDELGVDTFHLVGHDFGGAAAWELAASEFDRLLSMTSISNPHPSALGAALFDPESDQAARSEYVVALTSLSAADDLLADDAAALRETWAEAQLTDEQVAGELEVLGEWRAIHAATEWYRASFSATYVAPGRSLVPTMFLWSTDDAPLGPDPAFLTPPLGGRDFRFEVVQSVNHWLPNIVPDLVSDLLLDFLSAPGPIGDSDESFAVSNIRGAAYCDVETADGSWSTLGIGPCHRDGFEELGSAADAVASSRWVWVSDRLVHRAEIGAARKVGEVRVRPVPVSADLSDAPPYEPVDAAQLPELWFGPGQPILVLTDDNGARWVLRSVAVGDVDVALDAWLSSDATAALALPAGWTAEVAPTDQLLVVPAADVGQLLRDDSGNVYRLIG